MSRNAVLQTARIPALLAVLWLAEGLEVRWMSVLREGVPATSEVWMWSVGATLVTIAFTVVLLLGRRRRHPALVLVAELVIGLALALVPPLMWVTWFGIGGWTDVLLGSTVRTLGAVWLVVVVLHLVRRRRDATGVPA